MAQDHDDVGGLSAAQRVVSTAGRWRPAERRNLEWRAWGDEVVVYHAPAAATHLLRWPAGAMFATLLRSDMPMATPDLLRLVLGPDDEPPTGVELASAEATLVRLEGMGIISRCDP